MTTPVGASSVSTTSGIKSSSPAPPSSSNGGLGQDAFMKLLVAQMKYQDPLSPTDGQQYMTQMATFTQVEKLTQLVTAQAEVAQWQKRLSAEGMVGKEVSGADRDGATMQGRVTGVRHGADGPLLELADGRTLPLSGLARVATPGAAPAAPAARATSDTVATP